MNLMRGSARCDAENCWERETMVSCVRSKRVSRPILHGDRWEHTIREDADYVEEKLKGLRLHLELGVEQ